MHRINQFNKSGYQSASKLRRFSRLIKQRLPIAFSQCIVGLTLVWMTTSSGIQIQPSLNLITPLQTASPRLRFHAGGIKNGEPEILKELPAIPGPGSKWYLAQWQQRSYLRPKTLSSLGANGPWLFMAPDGHSSLRIDRKRSEAMYTLNEQDGILTEGGGANLFLATKSIVANSFATPMFLSLDYRLTSALVSARNSLSISSGAVQAMAFTGLGLMFLDSSGKISRFVFMQIPITVSRAVPPGPIIICTPNAGYPKLTYAPDIKWSPFLTQASVQHRRYNLSGLVKTMLSRPYPCIDRFFDWPKNQRDLAAWHLANVYVGLEVQNTDLRTAASDHTPQGKASLGLELSGLSITQEPYVAAD